MSQEADGYKYFAIVDEGRNRVVKKIVASQKLEAELAVLFEEQATEFLDAEIRRIAFDPRYKADVDDLFRIPDFALPESIRAAVNSSAQVESLVLSSESIPTIKSVFASRKADNRVGERVLFQRFDRSRVLRPGIFSLLMQRGTFEKLTETGITLDTQLTAAYEGGALYFRSLHSTSSFLDLTNIFVEATNADMEVIFKHDHVIVDDPAAFTAMADSQIRKKLSVVKSTGILDQVTVKSIVARANQFGLSIALKSPNGVDKFVLPRDKRDLKKFLTFLCEGYFKGALTDLHYETNSHRQVK